MGREIEIKILLDAKEYDFLYKVFIEQSESLKGVQVTQSSDKLIVKRDEYYSKYNSRQERLSAGEPQVIRLRTEETDGKSEAYFTLKYKSRENGIELNKEDETFVQNPEVLREFFTEAGYHKWFDKIKKNYSAYCKSEVLGDVIFHVELENVNELLYLEIEVTESDCDAAVVKQSLNDLVALLKIDPSRKDSRSWVEILSN